MRQPLIDRITLAWVRSYTRGIPDQLRDARRSELESDLWEHHATARRAGAGANATSISIAARALAGVPADLTWRRATKGALMSAQTTTVDGRGWIGMTTDILAATMGGFAALGGLGAMIGDADSAGWGALLLVTGLVLLAGAYLRTRRPPAGLTLIVVGAISWSLLFYWLVLTVVAGAVLVVLAVIATSRSRRREPA
jgi:hypothetical protein